MKSFTVAATTALLSTSYAANVKLSTTECLQYTPLEQFNVKLDGEATSTSLPSVCGLMIVSADEGTDINSIQCQAFKDAAGTVPGSKVFTVADPALIATNPVQIAAVRCSVAPSSTHLEARQLPTEIPSNLPSAFPIPSDIADLTSNLAGLSSAIADLTTSGSDASATPSGSFFVTSSPTGSASSGSVSASASASNERSTTILTSTVSASSGLPRPSNGTALSTSRPTPSASQSSASPSESTGAAVANGAVGMGVVLGALIAMFA